MSTHNDTSMTTTTTTTTVSSSSVINCKEQSDSNHKSIPYSDFNEDVTEDRIEDTDDDSGSESASVTTTITTTSWVIYLWDLIVSLYIPFLIQSLFGASFYLVRTLWLGYALQYVLELCTVTESYVFMWLGTKLSIPWSNYGIKPFFNSSTPLPVLIALGTLTIVALIVHPDGYTWIILQKLRDFVVAALQSSSICWVIAVNEFGAIVSTFLALATFASLFFLAYVLHKTLSPRTPAHIREQQDKHKRKKGKHKGRGKCSGRVRSNQMKVDSESRFEENKNETLPSLVEDEPVDPPPLLSTFESTANKTLITATKSDKTHLEPLRSRATSTSTLDSIESSVESGRSTPTPAAANELMQPPISTSLEHTSDALLKERNEKYLESAFSRKRQAVRREKKVETLETASRINAPNTISRRWDALKPLARGSDECKRPKGNKSTRQKWNTESLKTRQKEASAQLPCQKLPSADCSSLSEYPHQTLLRHHNNAGYFNSNHDFHIPPEMLFTETGSKIFGNSPTQQYLAPSTATKSDLCFSMDESHLSTPSVSVLDPNSPSWEDRLGQVRTTYGGDDKPLRPPPGLESMEHRQQYRGVPFGCGSSDKGGATTTYTPNTTLLEGSLLAFPFPSPYAFLSGYSHDETLYTSMPFRQSMPHQNVSRYVKENPFATSSDDNDDDDEKIAADLQELGGQMVGSILDF